MPYFGLAPALSILALIFSNTTACLYRQLAPLTRSEWRTSHFRKAKRRAFNQYKQIYKMLRGTGEASGVLPSFGNSGNSRRAILLAEHGNFRGRMPVDRVLSANSSPQILLASKPSTDSSRVTNFKKHAVILPRSVSATVRHFTEPLSKEASLKYCWRLIDSRLSV
jgi:hypothetical protein